MMFQSYKYYSYCYMCAAMWVSLLLISRLEGHLSKSRNCYASLQKTRLELEAQIDIKANSLYIDEVKCMSIRQSLQPQAY